MQNPVPVWSGAIKNQEHSSFWGIIISILEISPLHIQGVHMHLLMIIESFSQLAHQQQYLSMSAILESFFLHSWKLSFDTIAPSTFAIVCIAVVGLSLIFANAILYSCLLENDRSSSILERSQIRWNAVDFHTHRYREIFTRVGIVSIVLNTVWLIMIFGLKMTSRNWVIESIIWRLFICLISTSTILSEIRIVSKRLGWYASVEFASFQLRILTVSSSGYLWFHMSAYGL